VDLSQSPQFRALVSHFRLTRLPPWNPSRSSEDWVYASGVRHGENGLLNWLGFYAKGEE